MPRGVPSAARRISKMENGRRSNGSSPGLVLTMTNWPGLAAAAIDAAPSATTLYSAESVRFPSTSACSSTIILGSIAHPPPCPTCDC